MKKKRIQIRFKKNGNEGDTKRPSRKKVYVTIRKNAGRALQRLGDT